MKHVKMKDNWHVLIIIIIALSAITLLTCSASATYPIAVASSVEGPGLEADKAIDGDLTTRWSSNWTDNEWIYIDFGRPKLFNTVTLNWETAYANSYQIQVSDDAANWTTVYNTTSGDGGIETVYVGNQFVRFVKILGIKRATNWGYSLWEFTVSFKVTDGNFGGRQILLNGKPFTIKGVGYAPTPICANPGDYFTYNYRSIYARDLPLLRAINCNAIRLWGWDSTSNHSDFLDEAYNNGVDPIYVIAGYWIDPGRNLSDPNVREDIKNDFKNKWGTGVKYVLDDFDDGKPPNDFFADQGIWCEGSDSSINATFDNTTYYGENGRSLKLVYDAGSGDSLASYWEYFTFYYPDPWNPIYNMSEYDEFCLRVKGEGETIGSDTKFHIRFVDKNWNAAWVEIEGVGADWENKTIDLSTLRTDYPSVDWTQMRELTVIFDNNRHGEGRYAHPLSGTLYFDDLVFVDYDVNITTNDQFLDLISKRTFKYFWDTAHPTTGLMRDRATNRELCSIASVGFGLTSYCVATERGWVNRSDAAERVEKVLNTLWEGPHGNEAANVTGYNGFFYHFLDMETGYRYELWIPNCELSSIDTALLLSGVLTCKEYFNGSDATEKNITNLADKIYKRVNWTWMLNGGDTLSMGWTPETGFLPYRWEGYNEAMILYLLAIGSPNQNHSIPNSSWDAWAETYKWGCGDGEDFIYCWTGSLFTYQYSHCWIDFRNKHDAYADYWQNSIDAVKENRQFCIDNSDTYPTYGENCWGLTACDCPNGYCGYGSCPAYYRWNNRTNWRRWFRGIGS